MLGHTPALARRGGRYGVSPEATAGRRILIGRNRSGRHKQDEGGGPNHS